MINYDLSHAGEREVRALAGKVRPGEAVGRAIAGSITPGAWEFLAKQTMLVLGSWDGARAVWPSLIFGRPGFVSTQDGTTVRLVMDGAWADPCDPLWKNLRGNGLISMLAIELTTRRRLRINGHLPSNDLSGSDLDVIVDQAFANCPKYIQRRILRLDHTRVQESCIQESHALDADQARLIAGADTCFVASVHPEFGADVSHRGGQPGFVVAESATRLRIPDYAGNNMFSTLGNIQASGIAGLLFIDFDHGRQLRVIGDALIDWASASVSAERSWTLDICQVHASSLPSGMEWEYVDASPFNPALD